MSPMNPLQILDEPVRTVLKNLSVYVYTFTKYVEISTQFMRINQDALGVVISIWMHKYLCMYVT